MADERHLADGIDWADATPEQLERRASERGSAAEALMGVRITLPDGTVVWDSIPKPPAPAADPAPAPAEPPGPDEMTVEDAGVATGELYDPDWRPPEWR